MESLFGETPSSTASGVTKKSKYDMDSLFGDRSDESKALDATVKANLRQSVKEDPLKIFKSKMLSEELGLPTDVVNRNLVEVDATARAQKWDAKLTNSPTLKRMMADPYFAGVAHKDEMLPEVESLFREKGFAAASKMQRMDEASRAERLPAMMRDWNRQRDFSYAKAFGASFVGGAAQLAPNLLTAFSENVAEVPASQLQLVPAGGTLLSLLRPLMPEAAKYFRGISENVQRETEGVIGYLPEDATKRGIAQGVISYGRNIPTLIAGVLTGQPELALGVMGADVFGSEYMRGRKEGMSPAKATTFGGLQAATEYVTERVPFIKLIGDLGAGKDFATTFVKNQLGEQIGEQIATFTNDAIDWAYLNPDKTISEFLAERPDAMYQTAIATLVAGGGNVALATAIEKAGNFITTKEEKARYVEEQAKAMQQLFNFANTSTLKGIDAKSFEQLVQAAADDNDGSPSELYISGRTFQQLLSESDVDVNTMPTIAAQLQDAVENDTDIIAPIGELTVGLSNTGLESKVLENLKFEEDGLTLAEGRVAYEQSREVFKSEVEKTLADQEERTFFEQKADEIYKDIFTQLQEVKRNTKDANDLYAELIKQFYSTEAKQQSAATGSVVTPDIVFASLPALKVVGESVSGRSVLDQESPEFKAWFGDSKVVDEGGKPLTVYHGGRAGIEAFNNPDGKYKTGIFFVKSQNVANSFAGRGQTYPVYLSIQNPFVVDAQGSNYAAIARPKEMDGYATTNEVDTDLIAEWAFKNGFDGVIVNNVLEGRGGEVSDVYIASKNTQIKSINNRGTFDPNNPNILSQDAAPIFYSALYQGIDAAKLKDMPASQWKSWLNSNASKLGIKKEEIEWTSLNEYFDLRGKDKLSKQDVISYLENNGVKVEEVLLGSGASNLNYSSEYALPEVMFIAERYQGEANDALAIAIANDYDAYKALTNKFPELEEDDDWAVNVALSVTNGTGSLQTATRHHDWQLEGGENYRELLLTLPTPMEAYNKFTDKLRAKYGQGGFDNLPLTKDERATLDRLINESANKPFEYPQHWNQKNVVAHVRFNDRVDAEGNRILFIEELQSDWAQKGREEGFRIADVTEDQIEFRFIQPDQAFDEDGKPRNGHWELYYKDTGEFILRERGVYSQEEVARKALIAINEQMFRGHTPAAFVTETKSWVALATKRVMRYAADNGYDKVAFINGQQSADRYGLDKKLDALEWQTDDKYKYIQLIGLKGVSDQTLEIFLDKNTNKVVSMDRGAPNEWKGKHISSLVGKEIAEKIIKDDDGNLTQDGLKIGGKGMIAFYDQIIPIVVNEQLKKVGGGKLSNLNFIDKPQGIEVSVKQLENGRWLLTRPYGGSELPANRFASEQDAYDYNMNLAIEEEKNRSRNEIGNNQLGFEVTDAMREQILKGLPLFQGTGTQTLGTFDPDQFIITLKQGANLSTFLHETGHFFLEAKVKLATQEGARQQLKDDVNTLMQWFGTDLGTWQRMSLDEQRPFHERFARGFEAYLFEGKAPSVELKSAFQRFADWLKSIYQSVSKLLSDNNVQLTPEVRSVMDRMLATDEQIEEAKRRRGIMAMFNTAEEANMDVMEFFEYKAQESAITAEAKEKMTQRSLADIKYLRRARDKYIRNFQKDGEEKRREARIEARREVMSQPLYRAWSFLSGKDWGAVSAKEKQSVSLDPSQDSLFVAIAKLGGINRDLAISEFGLDIRDIQSLPTVQNKPVFRKEGGMGIDGMAETLSQFGYIATDENGKYDLAAFEDLIMDELSGSPQYSIAYDYQANMQDYVEGMQRDIAQQLPAGRLNLDEVKAMYGQNFQAVREKIGRMLTSDGLSTDIVAELFTNEDGTQAYGSGRELIDAMMAAVPPQMAIEDLTDKIVLERYGDITSEKAAQQAADEALHNEAMLRSAATEMKAITQMQGSVRDMTRAAKDAAIEAVNKILVRDLRPSKYITAANKAAREADAAVKAKKLDEAVAAKRRQMINLAMVQRAYEVQNEMRTAMKAFSAVNKADSKLSKTMDMNLVDTARSILASFGLNNADPRTAMDHLDNVKAYNPDLYAVLEPIARTAIASSRDENNNARSYQQLSIGEFMSLRDTIAQLTQQAREEKKITNKGRAVEIEEVNRLLSEQLDANGYQVEEIGKSIAPTDKDRRRWTLSSIKSAMRRMEHWVSMQDRNDFLGNFRSFLFQEVQDANTKYMTVKNRVLRQYVDMLRAKEAEGDFRTTKIAAPELGYTFTGKQELLGAMLHTGNESNKRKLLVGRNWGELVEGADKKRTLDTRKWDSFINRAISEGTITKSDYDFLQATWDLMESIKGDAQQSHYKLYGYYFDEVTSNAINTPFGSYRGGYAPAKADSDLVLEADIRQDINQLENDFNFMMPSTGNGFTKGRVEYNKPLVMDLRLVAQHLDQVLRFTYIQPAITDVLKIVKRGEFINKLNAIDKGALKSMIMPWLQRVATQTTSAPFQSDAGKKTAKFWQGLRRNTGMNIMFANAVNALQQTTGFSMAAVKVNPKYLKSAHTRYIKAPSEVANSISLMSDWMKIRLENQAFEMQTDLQEIMEGTTKTGKAVDYIRTHAYFMQRAMQNYVDIVAWSGAYDKAIAEGELNEQDAVKYADSVVRETQSSLLPIDISTMEAGNAFTQLFTQFTNYFNMQANLLGTNFAVAAKEMGFGKKGLGRMFYIYAMGFMLPAIVADGIVRTFGWDWDDEDDDGYLDEFMAWFLGSQVRTATAMVPYGGTIVNATLNKFNDKFYDDRITTSPAVSMLDQATAAPKSIYDVIVNDGSLKKAVKDSLTMIGLLTGVPLGALGRPAGYLIDWEEGKVEPENVIDITRGLASGKGREEERQQRSDNA